MEGEIAEVGLGVKEGDGELEGKGREEENGRMNQHTVSLPASSSSF